jgi:hypothetical protein
MEAMEKVDFRSAAPDAIVSTLLRQGSVLLGNFVDTAALADAYATVLRACEQTDRKHVDRDRLRTPDVAVGSGRRLSRPATRL